METVLINLGYGLMLGALLARDILWLRIMVLTAQSSLATYGYTYGDVNVAAWNTLFVIINGAQILRVMRERQPVVLNEVQEVIYNAVFASMSKRDFLIFWEMGTLRRIERGRLIREGDTPQDLLLIVDGEAEVQKNDATIARLSSGQFAAEMSFISNEPASADVVVNEPVQYLSWSQEKLRSLRVLNPHLFIMLQGLLGKDLARKIRAQNTGSGSP